MKTAALIVAAGRGTRAGGAVPKQWRPVAGRPLAEWTIDRFLKAPEIDLIVLVLDPSDAEKWREYNAMDGIVTAPGGDDRAGSVASGLAALNGAGVDKVLIHDVARPCLSADLISELVAKLDTVPAVAPALPVSDALWIGAEDTVTGTQDRTGLFAAQTPQAFRYDAIVAAHAAHPGGAADDVEVARAADIPVTIIAGHPDNLKVTRPEDFDRAARILEQKHMDIRVGNGYDVHRFGPGDHVTLCGVAVPFDRGLQGHSDADVGMHAVTDAIYGALARGDIGQHFPPSDMQWKGAESHIFLRHAVALAAEMGFRVNHVDCTLICEMPKIRPHAAAMRSAMAEIMGLDEDRVSVKATTSERLGFTGRGEGIAAQASATLVPA